jgi:hypothetical protein
VCFLVEVSIWAYSATAVPGFSWPLGELGGDKSLQTVKFTTTYGFRSLKMWNLVADSTLMNRILPCNFCHHALPASVYVSAPTG